MDCSITVPDSDRAVVYTRAKDQIEYSGVVCSCSQPTARCNRGGEGVASAAKVGADPGKHLLRVSSIIGKILSSGCFAICPSFDFLSFCILFHIIRFYYYYYYCYIHSLILSCFTPSGDVGECLPESPSPPPRAIPTPTVVFPLLSSRLFLLRPLLLLVLLSFISAGIGMPVVIRAILPGRLVTISPLPLP